uniref:Cytochrome c oxidase subunit 2 n=1 Tax=Owenia fusiformis TaxID=6347 RepID=A0A0S2N0D6_OWEFU|nr:cytochrome c oxidase subunit II [Owenia fusiformis]ALO81687.1 cytochrome c oxidase subunit II [Owenia fusiformis]
MTSWGSLGLVEAGSPLMEQLIFFHDYAMCIMLMIIFFVGVAGVFMIKSSFTDRYVLEENMVEVIWTIVPVFILICLALPSLRLLYLLDESSSPSLTLKVIGHQWYWSYEYSDFKDLEFDSYMIPTEELDMGGYRLLEVDHRAVLPVGVEVRVLVSAADVLHSWTVPGLGVKADAVPGRLNQLSFVIMRSGVWYGQCSEICGANHSFMPIVVEGVSCDSFMNWVGSLVSV